MQICINQYTYSKGINQKNTASLAAVMLNVQVRWYLRVTVLISNHSRPGNVRSAKSAIIVAAAARTFHFVAPYLNVEIRSQISTSRTFQTLFLPTEVVSKSLAYKFAKLREYLKNHLASYTMYMIPLKKLEQHS